MLYNILVLSTHNTCKDQMFNTTGLYLASITFQYLKLQVLVLVDGTCLTGCKFERCHLVVYRQIYNILVPSIHNTCKDRMFITTGLYLLFSYLTCMNVWLQRLICLHINSVSFVSYTVTIALPPRPTGVDSCHYDASGG